MKKLILVNPMYSNQEIYSSISERIPLGLIILDNIFNNYKIDSQVIDLNVITNKEQINNITYEKLAEIICDKSPDFVGITSMANNYINAILLAKQIKKRSEKIQIFMGGPQASFVAKETLESFQYIDFIVRGESEKVVPVLADYFNGLINIESIPNLTFRKGNEVIENIEKYPLIGEEEIPIIDYSNYMKSNNLTIENIDTFSIEGGRGCPFNCTFCSTSSYWSRKFRIKNYDRIIKEMNILNKKYNVTKFNLVHDLFTCNKKSLYEFCNKIRSLSYTWSCSSRVDVLDYDTLDIMKESGCTGIFFGIESGDTKTQKIINKNLKIECADDIIKYCKKIGIATTVSFIIGFPHETIESINKTILKLLEYTILGSNKYFLSILTPEHGSKIFEDKKNDMMFSETLYDNNRDSWNIDIKKEKELIKKYPFLFNHYYSFISNEFNDFYIEAIHRIFSILRFFHKTLYLYSKICDQNLLRLFDKFMKWNNKKKLHEAQFLECINEGIIIDKFMEYFENNVLDKRIRELYKYERDIMDLNNKKSSKHISNNILLNKYKYNIAKIILGIKNNVFDFNEEEIFIAAKKKDKINISLELLNKEVFELLKNNREIKFEKLTDKSKIIVEKLNKKKIV